jgi:hypothetical protein
LKHDRRCSGTNTTPGIATTPYTDATHTDATHTDANRGIEVGVEIAAAVVVKVVAGIILAVVVIRCCQSHGDLTGRT